MRKQNNRDYFNDEKYSRECGAQPRKSSYQKKNPSGPANFLDDEDERHHTQRREPGKNVMRMQLRRIEYLL